MIQVNKRQLLTLCMIVVVLSIPLIAMQFTNQIQWDLFDFVIAGIVLLGVGCFIELIIQKVRTKKNRMMLFIVLALLFLLLWVELAAGIFGSPIAG